MIFPIAGNAQKCAIYRPKRGETISCQAVARSRQLEAWQGPDVRQNFEL
jgi:hypothetical protein